MTNPRGSWWPYLKTSKQNPQTTTTTTTIFSIILFFIWQIGVNSFRLYCTPSVTALIWTPIFFPCFMFLCSSALQEIRQNEEETHLYKLRKSQKVSVVCKSKREANLKKWHHGDQDNSSPTFSLEQHITVGFKGLTPNQKSVMNLEISHKICTMNRNYFKFLHIYLDQESDLSQFGSFVWDIFFDPSTEAAFRWQPGWRDHLIRVVLVQIKLHTLF